MLSPSGNRKGPTIAGNLTQRVNMQHGTVSARHDRLIFALTGGGAASFFGVHDSP